jgi:hypothetical protein
MPNRSSLVALVSLRASAPNCSGGGKEAVVTGGDIRRLTQRFDPQGYEVVAAPDATEKAHHHLRRFCGKTPKVGHESCPVWLGQFSGGADRRQSPSTAYHALEHQTPASYVLGQPASSPRCVFGHDNSCRCNRSSPVDKKVY